MQTLTTNEFYNKLRTLIHEEVRRAVIQGTSEFLTADELALHIKVDKSWVYKRVKRQRNPLPHYDMDGTYRFKLAEVEEWMKYYGKVPRRVNGKETSA